jgi:hypothetical protein
MLLSYGFCTQVYDCKMFPTDNLQLSAFICLVHLEIKWHAKHYALNGTHQLLVYADDVNILGGSIHTIRKNIEALVIADKEIGLKVNAEKIKHMVMFQDQNVEQNSNIHIGVINPLKWWNSLNIWEPQWIKIPFMKELRADLIWGMLAIIWCRIVCLPLYYPKM